MSYVLHLLVYFNIYVIVALSLNIVVGYSGLLSLAHASFFAVGAYSYALSTLSLGWGFAAALGLSLLLGMVASVTISLPSLRLRGEYFLILSLGLQQVFIGLLRNWSQPDAALGTMQNMTNGPLGIAKIPRPAIGDIEFASQASFSALATGLMLLVVFLCWLLLHSPWGRLLKATRDDLQAARSLGKPVRRIRVEVFGVSCGLAALGGCIYSSYLGFIDPGAASLDESILFLSFLLVGGGGNLRGPIVGALVLLLIPELLRMLTLPPTMVGPGRLMAYGLLLILVVHLRPQGIAGDYKLD